MTTIAAPAFIIHAAGSLGNRPDLGKKAYRLHARFEIGAHPSGRQLEKAMHYWMDRFIEDMAKRGYEYVSKYPIEATFKGAYIAPVALPKPPRVLSAREMLPQIRQGAKFRAEEVPGVQTVPHFNQTAVWSYDLSAVFIHDAILMDVPDLHEEKRPA